MSTQTKPRLALRALNDSRRADPLAYLSLRYTLDAVISLRDAWAQEIAPEIVRRRPAQTFLESKLFKQYHKDEILEFRDVVRSGGPETLAEVALLDACSKAGDVFKPAEEVYSYHLAKRNSMEGAFVPYFKLFSARQKDIGKMCEKHQNDWVLYADIRQFYPSITAKKAIKAWEIACQNSTLAAKWQKFGRLLLDRQFSSKRGLLVGLMFSHLVANLVLRDLDKEMVLAYPGRYFRYVDDFAFIIPKNQKRKTVALLRKRLKSLKLSLHPKKIHLVSTLEWRENAPYQADEYDEEPIGDSDWMCFIDHVKCYLMAKPKMRSRIESVFFDAGLRVPLPRYTVETMAKTYGDRFNKRMASNEFAETIKLLSPASLLKEGMRLRKTYDKQFDSAWVDFSYSTGLVRKWKLSKVRYLLGRMLLIGSIERVKAIHRIIENESDVAEYSAMFDAVLNRRVDSLLSFGWKIAASAGQVLAAASIPVTCRCVGWKQEHVEAYAALLLAGVTVDVKLVRRLETDMRLQAVLVNERRPNWAKMPYSFYREFFALISGKNLQDHQSLMLTPADPDERWEVFADEILGLEPS